MAEVSFEDAATGLLRGDFSRLDPLFEGEAASPIVRWFEEGRFLAGPLAAAEALSCACFNGRAFVARFLLDRGIDPEQGSGTGLNAFHWAANRGQVETVRLLIERAAPLESVNSYGGTVLDCAVYSALNEPKPTHKQIISMLVTAGADVRAVDPFPTGNAEIDALLSGGSRAQHPS